MRHTSFNSIRFRAHSVNRQQLVCRCVFPLPTHNIQPMFDLSQRTQSNVPRPSLRSNKQSSRPPLIRLHSRLYCTETISEVVYEASRPGRLDVITSHLAQVSRRGATGLIEQGLVTVNGRKLLKVGHSVLMGDKIGIKDSLQVIANASQNLPCLTASPASPHSSRDHFEVPSVTRPIRILKETNEWVAVDKPSGMHVHPKLFTESGTSLNFVVRSYPQILGIGEGGVKSGVVHRLDFATSGVLIFALTSDAWTLFRSKFSNHSMNKTYDTIVEGHFKVRHATVRVPLAMESHSPAKVAVSSSGFKSSLTYTVISEGPAHSLVRVQLHTGFLHQIRVTFAYLKHPLVGDPIYGPQINIDQDSLFVDINPAPSPSKPRSPPRISSEFDPLVGPFLHATELMWNGVSVCSPHPPHFVQAVEAYIGKPFHTISFSPTRTRWQS